MKGPAGIILINDLMPIDVRFPLNKKIDSAMFKRQMNLFARKHPTLYAQKVGQIAAIGEHMAFYLGGNVGPNDLKIDDKKRMGLIKGIENRLGRAKTDDAKRAVLIDGLRQATKLSISAAGRDNEMVQQVISGSRGKPVQLARMTVGPIYAVDMDQQPKLNLIRNSFSGGLNSQEYFNAASQGRYASVQSANATSEPGALSKVLIANADAQKITEIDCGTRNGIDFPITDHHLLGRFEAGTNHLIDESYIRQLKRQKKKKVTARTPTTCHAKKGICAKCYGSDSSGRLPAVGDNVGIKAAQTSGEIMTQMSIGTKHSTMGKLKTTQLTGVSGFKTIVNSPTKFYGAATIATEGGSVTKIEKAPQGGHYVYVGNKKYITAPSQEVSVKVGDSISTGDRLSGGVITPKQVLAHRGINAARHHEASLLHDLFKRSTGRDIQKKHFEVLARGHLSLGANDIGEIGSYSNLTGRYPKTKHVATVGGSIVGKYLAEDYGTLSKGLKIDKRAIDDLGRMGKSSVEVTEEKPSISPVYKTMEQKPNFAGDLFSKMNYRAVTRAIKDEILYNDNPSAIEAHGSDRAQYSAGML